MREAVAVFHDAEQLEDAVDALQSSGFDRADISLLAEDQVPTDKLGQLQESVRDLEDDPDAPRRPFLPSAAIGEAKGAAVGSLLFLGGVIGAGTVALSGGALLPAATAAAAGGGGGAALGGALAKLFERRIAQRLERQIRQGGLLLWVRVRDDARERRALDLLRRYGGHHVHVHEVPALQ